MGSNSTRQHAADKIDRLTSNQYYGGLNRRFDRRAALLIRLRFKYVAGEHGAAFVRPRVCRPANSIPAAMLAHADNRAWFDLLARILRHGFLSCP